VRRQNLSTADFIIRAQAKPGSKMVDGFELGQVWPNLGENHMGRQLADTVDLCQIRAQNPMHVGPDVKIWRVALCLLFGFCRRGGRGFFDIDSRIEFFQMAFDLRVAFPDSGYNGFGGSDLLTGFSANFRLWLICHT
jgi:hypothetical protein